MRWYPKVSYTEEEDIELIRISINFTWNSRFLMKKIQLTLNHMAHWHTLLFVCKFGWNVARFECSDNEFFYLKISMVNDEIKARTFFKK
jgi:hypothetical protein